MKWEDGSPKRECTFSQVILTEDLHTIKVALRNKDDSKNNNTMSTTLAIVQRERRTWACNILRSGTWHGLLKDSHQGSSQRFWRGRNRSNTCLKCTRRYEREQLTSWDAAAIAPTRIISLKRGTEGGRTMKILSKWTCSSSTRIGKKWILRLLLIRFLCIPISDPGNAEPLALHRHLPKLGTCCFLYTLSLEKGRPGNLVCGGSAKSAVRTKPKSARKNGKVATPYDWSNLVHGGSARSAGRRKPKSIRKNRKVASPYYWSFLLLPWLHTPLGDYIEFEKQNGISTTVPAACKHGSSSSTHHPPASEHKQEDEEKQTI